MCMSQVSIRATLVIDKSGLDPVELGQILQQNAKNQQWQQPKRQTEGVHMQVTSPGLHPLILYSLWSVLSWQEVMSKLTGSPGADPTISKCTPLKQKNTFKDNPSTFNLDTTSPSMVN